jgi:hypothetical protein
VATSEAHHENCRRGRRLDIDAIKSHAKAAMN